MHHEGTMKYTATITRDSSGFSAECVEVDAIGEGPSREAAIASLRVELEDRIGHVEGVAPPPDTPRTKVEIVVLDERSPNEAVAP